MIIQLLLNVDEYGSKQCKKCTEFSNDSVEHILFECKVGEEYQGPLWNKILASCPTGMLSDIINMNNNNRVVFMLNAMKCSYIKEWYHLYEDISLFVNTLYKKWIEL